MAESVREGSLSNNLSNDGLLSKIECAVCLQTCVHPAELPCGHIFCYLCIKGIVNQGRRCAMCRQEIPVDYLDKPRLLNPVDTELPGQVFEDGHLWFYEGHNGWWQYDERTSLELESAYQKGERCCDLLIAGCLYIADFDGMLQYRRNDPSRRRRIKRDLATTSKKGIAGLKATKSGTLPSVNSSDGVSSDMIQNVSTSSVSNSLAGLQIFTSASNNSRQYADRGSDPLRLREISTSGSSTCRLPAPTNANSVSQTDSSIPYSSNLNLDNAIHDTLDWTIEQIEFLNLELLNDYESLFRDVNSYGQLQNNLNQSHFRRTPNNYISRYLNVRDSSSETPGSGLNLNDRISDLPISSNSDVNNLPVESTDTLLEDTDNIYSDVLETSSDLSLESNVEIPQPPPRSRGMSRSRPRGDPLRQSSDPNCDTLFQKFISNK